MTSVRRLAPYLREFRWQLISGAALGVITNAVGLGIPLIVRATIDGPISHHNPSELVWLVLAGIGLASLRSSMSALRRWLLVRSSALCETKMRNDFYRHVQRLPVAFHDKWSSGQLLSRVIGDLNTIQRCLSFPAIYFFINLSLITMGITLLFVLSLPLGIIVLACNTPTLFISTFYESQYRALFRKAQDQMGEVTSVVEESVLGIRVIKAYGRGMGFYRVFSERIGELRETELQRNRVAALFRLLAALLPALSVTGLLAFGGWQIAVGSMTIGTLVAALSILAYIKWPFEGYGAQISQINAAAAACERYWEVMDKLTTITSPENPRKLFKQSNITSPSGRKISFENVHFKYREFDQDSPAGKEILRGVNLTVNPGETLALVGATGSGKTTLTALIPRLFDVTSGRVLLDGVDVRELSFDELRTTVGMAFEEPFLFSASIRENVVLGRPDISDERVNEALQTASAKEFVDALPWGLDTQIGEQGMSLSGGQRQRLALARAVLGRPDVLVLDDPLSALDVHTEAEVESALRQVLRGVTALVVAHRPSTVQLADRVALLEDGRITAVDTHQRLLQENLSYRNLLSTMDKTQITAQAGVTAS